MGNDSLIVEVTGDEEKVNSLLQMLRPFGIKEMVRTGIVAMTRGGRHRRPPGRGAPGSGRLDTAWYSVSFSIRRDRSVGTRDLRGRA